MSEALRNPVDFYRQGGFDPVTGMPPVTEEAAAQYRKFRSDNKRPLKVLDVGCGSHAILSQLIDKEDDYTGCDIVESVTVPVRYFPVDLNTTRLDEAMSGETYDVIFCLEVVEHLFNPDEALRAMKAMLKPGGIVIVSTPNLAYWMNRVLLLVGISPMFLENSAEVKLGRKFKQLGQGNRTEGHIRLFTYTAMLEMLERCGLELVTAKGSHVWPSPIDKIIARISPRFSPDVSYVAKATDGPISIK